MIGLGPHWMTTVDWVLGLGMAGALLLLAITTVWSVGRTFRERTR